MANKQWVERAAKAIMSRVSPAKKAKPKFSAKAIKVGQLIEERFGGYSPHVRRLLSEVMGEPIPEGRDAEAPATPNVGKVFVFKTKHGSVPARSAVFIYGEPNQGIYLTKDGYNRIDVPLTSKDLRPATASEVKKLLTKAVGIPGLKERGSSILGL